MEYTIIKKNVQQISILQNIYIKIDKLKIII